MTQTWIYTIISVFVISLVSLIGVFSLSVSLDKLKKILLFLVSFAAGALLGGAFLHLIPEAFEEADSFLKVSLFVLLGIVIFFILEKVIHWRHCHIPTSDEHPHPLGMMNLIGDAFHNFIDGMIIAGSFLISPALGLTTSLAVLLHEVPQEIGDFGILLHAGYSRKKALFFNFLSALTAVLGAILTIIIGTRIEGITHFIVPFTAGGFIYIATADLIPELKKEVNIPKSAGQLLAILLGIGVMALVLLMD